MTSSSDFHSRVHENKNFSDMLLDELFDPSPSETTPVACDPSVLTDRERNEHEERSKAVFAEREEMREVPGGYAFRFPGTTEYAERLVEVVRYERQCCPFLSFGIAFEPEERGIWLYMGGDENAEEYLAQEFDPERLDSA